MECDSLQHALSVAKRGVVSGEGSSVLQARAGTHAWEGDLLVQIPNCNITADEVRIFVSFLVLACWLTHVCVHISFLVLACWPTHVCVQIFSAEINECATRRGAAGGCLRADAAY
jgi:hypothetical protein